MDSAHWSAGVVMRANEKWIVGFGIAIRSERPGIRLRQTNPHLTASHPLEVSFGA
jgi:hypothetical protein